MFPDEEEDEMADDDHDRRHVTRGELRMELKALRNDFRVWLIAILAGNQVLNRTDLTDTASAAISGGLAGAAVIYKIVTVFKA